MVTERSSSELPFRLGCPLALLVAAALAAAVEWLVYGRPYRPGEWQFYVLQAMFLGAPFGMLALARARDWLAWLTALALTAVAWGYLAYDMSLNPGVNFGLGFAFTFTPLLIGGLGVAVAGMRGRIAWARDNPADDPIDTKR